jgi:hypothetical protein
MAHGINPVTFQTHEVAMATCHANDVSSRKDGCPRNHPVSHCISYLEVNVPTAAKVAHCRDTGSQREARVIGHLQGCDAWWIAQHLGSKIGRPVGSQMNMRIDQSG